MLKGLTAGITSYGKATQLLSKLGLWGYVFIPALISLLIASIVGFTAWNLSDDIGDMFISWYPWETGQSVVERISTIFSGLLILALGLILYKHLVMILSAPFMSPLSEKVENYLVGSPSVIRFSLPRC